MITGVQKGFTYKLKIVFSHFPISVKAKDKFVLIENFIGERNPRKAKTIGDVQVKIQSEDVIIQGINLEDVSQTAANIEQATKVKRKDPRVFLDGIYVYEKVEGTEG
jgi:large subunit ribosomal protein L6